MELVISQFILTSALTNDAMKTTEMDHQLHATWMFFRDELMYILNGIESLQLESLMAGNLYSKYQQEVYNQVYDYHLDTLEELQVAMEQL